ncbi:murein biosynthesis integral membrane protein MurJ [Rubricella aquisinus]|uniref:murein biosynthesis integral membrane protein MurJ n=1 Tax=Rubricella aquisinus TaxID=2028108 RepID=UPI001611713E
MKRIRLLSAFLTVGAWTLLSRVFGFARDLMIAAFLGSGPVAEAFLVAFSLPNMFRRIFAEGAFNTAFVPMFAKRLETGEGAQPFAQNAMSALATVLILFTLVGQIAMPVLVWMMASGFRGDERFDLAVEYGRIAFVYILFISLAALLSGVLNAMGRFVAAAAAPVLLNIVLSGALVLAAVLDRDVGLWLVWAVPVAGMVQVALVWTAAKRAGMRLIPQRPRLTPELKRLAIIALPAALAGGVMQINLLVGRQVASYFEGAIAWLNYADRLYQLPLGVVGIAIGIVLLPDLSRRLGAGDDVGGRDAVNRAAEFSLFLTLPAAVALVIIPQPIVSVLFERGAFSAQDAQATAFALMIYALGLPAFVLLKVVQPLFFAREDTKTPFRVALIAMAVNAGVAIGLAPVIGYIAAAGATTLAAWVNLAILWRLSHQFGDAAKIDARLARSAPRMLVASVGMGAVLIGIEALLGDMLSADGLRYLALLALVGGGMLAYFVLGAVTGAMPLAEVKRRLRR